MNSHRHNTEKFLYPEDSDSEDNNCSNNFGDLLLLRNHQPLTRKRRRGMIEKRRRDRINNCLLELKRLVPAAFEKQNSQKLEKAEILQMTVDHLRYMNYKTPDYQESKRNITEYHCQGFKECINEIDNFFHSSIIPIVSITSTTQFKETLKHQLLAHLEHHLHMKRHQIFAIHPQSYYPPNSVWNFTPNFQINQNSSATNHANLSVPCYSTASAGHGEYYSAHNGQDGHLIDHNHPNLHHQTQQQPKPMSIPTSTAAQLLPAYNNEVRNGGSSGLNLNLTFVAPNSSSSLVPVPALVASGYKF